LLQSVARMATPCNKTIIMFFYWRTAVDKFMVKKNARH
jgi:hypothetical protein